MLSKFVLCVLLSGCLGQKTVGNRCTTTEGVEGFCQYATQCNDALISIKKYGFHKLARCGFEDLSEIVCCLNSDYAYRFDSDNGVFGKRGFTESEGNSIGSPSVGVSPIRRADAACREIKQSFPPPTESHILEGTDATAGEFPHMATIGYSTDNSNLYVFKCGGSLISASFVLTAAHCQSKSFVHIIPKIVRTGIVNLGEGTFNPETDHFIEEFILHPNFHRVSDDIALIKLKSPVVLTELAHPACLHLKEEIPTEGLIVTGWGIKDYEILEYSPVLLKTNLTLVSKADCVKKYEDLISRYRRIKDTMLCAGDVAGGGHDACMGDSGGPLQAFTEKDGFYRIIGIVSFGVSCGTRTPGVYTRITSYLDWIESIVWP